MCADNPRVVAQRLPTFSAPIESSGRVTAHSESGLSWAGSLFLSRTSHHRPASGSRRRWGKRAPTAGADYSREVPPGIAFSQDFSLDTPVT